MAEKQYDISWPGWNVAGILGYGSYGRVYAIERDVFGHTEKAALKVISIPQNDGEIEELYNDGYDSESITRRFKSHLQDIVREYSLMSEMKGHTNIVYCDDLRYVQHDDGMGWDIYIKMELLTPLPKLLVNGFSEKLAVKLGLDICNALILCKSKNIVHRDIKPQNIFVSEDGNFKLGDFGIAKTAERTTSGTKTGTYKYMAPEVYNNQPYGHSADIYSLGMVLYWLLNERRTPFLLLPPQTPTATDEERARNSRFAGFPIPEPAHGSNELKRIVLKACAFSPEDRYKSATEMRNDILSLVRNGSYTAQNLQIKSPIVTKPQMLTPVDTDEMVGNFAYIPKEEMQSEETVGIFDKSVDNKRPIINQKGLLILKGAILFIFIFFLAFIMGSTISHIHFAMKSNERNAVFTVNSQLESTGEDTRLATESTAVPAQFAEISTTLTEGDTISFGKYEVDGNSANGKEEITWLVLTKKDNQALLLSLYALDSKPFHKKYERVTWDESTIRQWLNGSFYNSAFTENEKAVIVQTSLLPDENPYAECDPGRETVDYVFLLSLEELDAFIQSNGNIDNDALLCYPTDYAVQQGTYKNEDTSGCWWWLRTSADGNLSACSVNSDKKMDYHDGKVNSLKAGVRPAIWVSIG